MGKKEQIKIDGGDIKKDEALSILDDLKESAEDIGAKDDMKQLDMMIDYFTKSWDKIDYTFEEFDVPMGSVPEVYLDMMNEIAQRQRNYYDNKLPSSQKFDKLIKETEENESTYKMKLIRLNREIIKLYKKDLPPSPKKGKKYPNEQTYRVTDLLEKYWDDNLPLGDNRKSYFNKIADKLGLSFKRVETIELEYRPSSALLPKKKK